MTRGSGESRRGRPRSRTPLDRRSDIRRRRDDENLLNNDVRRVPDVPGGGRSAFGPPVGPPATDLANDQVINEAEASGESSNDEEESFFGPSDAEEEGDGMLDGVTAWNSPEGWESVKPQIAEFCAAISEVGCVCAVCGERKHDTRPVTSADLRMWQVNGPPTASLIDGLYPPYPEQTFARVSMK